MARTMHHEEGSSVATQAAEQTAEQTNGTTASIVPEPVALGEPDDIRSGAIEVLERKIDELESCVRSLSHDLRSPLVSILGFSRLLRDDYGERLAPTGLHFLDRIEQAGRHMERLLRDMLEFSRIDGSSDTRVHVDPTPILQQVLAELKLHLEEKKIELDLPENPPTLLIDRTRLYQLFANLIGNAVRHMDRDEDGRIRVEIEAVADGWRILVDDNGPGIAPEDHQRIFDVFQTAGRSSGRDNGGLGLAIVKKIVETHSGRVWVESESGQGSRFVVWLPGI